MCVAALLHFLRRGGGVWRAQVLSQQGLPRRGQSGPQGVGDSLHRRLGGGCLLSSWSH